MAATLICGVNDCKHRSKRKLKSWRGPGGSPCYGCTRPYVNIMRVFDPDGDIEAVSGKENTAICAFYEPEYAEHDDDELEDD